MHAGNLHRHCWLKLHSRKSAVPAESALFSVSRWTSWDADTTGAVNLAASVEDVVLQLRALPGHEVRRLQRMGALVRSVFQYKHSSATQTVAGQELAGDLIVQAICKRAQREATARAGQIAPAES